LAWESGPIGWPEPLGIALGGLRAALWRLRSTLMTRTAVMPAGPVRLRVRGRRRGEALRLRCPEALRLRCREACMLWACMLWAWTLWAWML